MKKLLALILVFGLLIQGGSALAQTNQSTFTIGSNCATINGISTTMDVTPYIQGNRTFLPIRYVAHALGIADDKILWDERAQRVFLFDGSKAVSVQLGSNIITVSGAGTTETPMDVVPLVVNERVCLPISHIASAFGATSTWDGGNRITINPSEPVQQIVTIPTKQTITLSDGSTFTGMVLNGTPAGYGIKTKPDGSTIEGTFTGEIANGQVKIILPNGARYEGGYVNGIISGSGTLWTPTGYKYVGGFLNGKFDGYGTMFHPNGDRYSGYYKAGQQNGPGTYYYASGLAVKLYFINGQPAPEMLNSYSYTPSIPSQPTYSPPTSTTVNSSTSAQAIANIEQIADQKRSAAESAYQLAYKQLTIQYQEEKESIASYYAGRGIYNSSICENALKSCDAKYQNAFDTIEQTRFQTLAQIGQWEKTEIAKYR